MFTSRKGSKGIDLPASRYFYLFFILMFLIVSCQPEQEEPIMPVQDEASMIKEAKQYFDEEVLCLPEPADAENSRQESKGKARQVLLKNALWEEAYIRELSIGKAVAVPLAFSEEVYAEAGNTGTGMPISRLTYLLIYKDGKGKKHAEVVTTLPDAEWYAHADSTEPFSGTVLVEDWQGNFIKGYIYKDGKILPAGPVNDQTNNGRIAGTTVCVTTQFWYCVTTPYSTDCRPSYTETTCTTTGGSGGGDVGAPGGDYPNPPDGFDRGGPGLPAPLYTEEEAINMWEEDRIDDSNLAPCMQPILNDLKTLEKGVGKIVADFADDIPGYNWEVKDGSLPGGTGATNPPALYNSSTGTITTTFDTQSWLSATDLSWARTMLHESIHANLAVYFAINRPGWIATYPQMVAEWGRLQNWNDVHHEEIARSIVGDISKALQEYGIKNGYNLSQQFYDDMAWAGLQNTATFGKLSATDQARILNVIAVELTGKDTNGNSQPQKGKSAGC